MFLVETVCSLWGTNCNFIYSFEPWSVLKGLNVHSTWTGWGSQKMCCPKFACAISVISCVWLQNVQNYWERKSIIPPTLHLKYRKMNVWLGRKLTDVNVCRKEWSAERVCGKVRNVIFKKLSDQICVCVCVCRIEMSNDTNSVAKSVYIIFEFGSIAVCVLFKSINISAI